jgi:hypothetical protein
VVSYVPDFAIDNRVKGRLASRGEALVQLHHEMLDPRKPLRSGLKNLSLGTLDIQLQDVQAIPTEVVK